MNHLMEIQEIPIEDREGPGWSPMVRYAALATMTEEVYQNTVEKGWYETDRTFGDDIALLHSEVSEALEAFRDGGVTDQTAPPMISNGENPKPEGVGAEFADVLIRLLDTCKRHGIDLAWEYQRKMAYNRTRPYRHGGRAL